MNIGSLNFAFSKAQNRQKSQLLSRDFKLISYSKLCKIYKETDLSLQLQPLYTACLRWVNLRPGKSSFKEIQSIIENLPREHKDFRISLYVSCYNFIIRASYYNPQKVDDFLRADLSPEIRVELMDQFFNSVGAGPDFKKEFKATPLFSFSSLKEFWSQIEFELPGSVSNIQKVPAIIKLEGLTKSFNLRMTPLTPSSLWKRVKIGVIPRDKSSSLGYYWWRHNGFNSEGSLEYNPLNIPKKYIDGKGLESFLKDFAQCSSHSEKRVFLNKSFFFTEGIPEYETILIKLLKQTFTPLDLSGVNYNINSFYTKGSRLFFYELDRSSDVFKQKFFGYSLMNSQWIEQEIIFYKPNYCPPSLINRCLKFMADYPSKSDRYTKAYRNFRQILLKSKDQRIHLKGVFGSRV